MDVIVVGFVFVVAIVDLELEVARFLCQFAVAVVAEVIVCVVDVAVVVEDKEEKLNGQDVLP